LKNAPDDRVSLFFPGYLDRYAAYNAELVIPGYKRPGMPFDNSSFTFTRDSLIVSEEELAKCNGIGKFHSAMIQHFPKANLFISTDMNANVFKGDRISDSREDE
jgi:hypothetical protein